MAPSPWILQARRAPNDPQFFRTQPFACCKDRNQIGVVTMSDNLSLSELDDRIAVLRDNLRQLVEQAAAASGSQSEERIADRIAQQSAALDKLVAERDARSRK
jgi:hypothetical protein